MSSQPLPTELALPAEAYQPLLPGQEYPPVVPDTTVVPELTARALIVGILVAVISGAANAYLGLKVGLTVSASIPAAVAGVAIFQVLPRRSNPLEINIVQTIGSSGEALAAGVIFTLPVLDLWGESQASGQSFPSRFWAACWGCCSWFPCAAYSLFRSMVGWLIQRERPVPR